MGSNDVSVPGGGGGGGMQDPITRPLSRQGSLYSLTLDEVHNQIGNVGKPLGSMNLDELLKSVRSSDATNQASDASEGIENPSSLYRQGNPLQKQPSFILSRALSKKTVNEVWKDIRQGNYKKDVAMPYDGRKGTNRDRQTMLGEITIDDFLSLAGAVDEPQEASKAGPTTGSGCGSTAGEHFAAWPVDELPACFGSTVAKCYAVVCASPSCCLADTFSCFFSCSLFGPWISPCTNYTVTIIIIGICIRCRDSWT